MVEWIKTMEAEGVVCRVKVSNLDRAYRDARTAKDEIADKHPDVARFVEKAFESVHQLYTDAHAYSPGVPLSHKQFTQIGCSQLPAWAKL